MATFNYNVLQLNSFRRKIILFILDNIICLASFFLAFYLRLDLFLINETQNQIISFLIVYITFIILCFSFSFYRPLSRYYDLLNIAKIILVFFFYAFLILLLFSYLKLPGIPRSLGILHPIIFLIFFISSRIFANFFIRNLYNVGKLSNIIICCNINSAESLKNILKSYNVLFFTTDDEKFQKRLIGNIPIYTLSNLKKSMFKDKNIDYLFIDPNLNVESVKKKIR